MSTAGSSSRRSSLRRLANFVNGEFIAPASGAYLDDINPSTGHILAAIPDSDAAHVDAAVRAARRAFRDWSETPAAERSKLLLKLADLIERNLDELAKMEAGDKAETVARAKRRDMQS